MVKSKFDIRIPYFIFIAAICSFLISFFLLQLFTVILVMLWVLEKNVSKKAAFDNIWLLFILFGLFRLVSIFLSPYPSVSMPVLLKEALFYLGFFAFSFYLKAFDNEKFKLIIYWFVGAAAVTALTGIVRFDLGIVHRAQSFSSGYMAFSAYLLAALGAGVIIYSSGVKRFGIWIPAACIILILTGIVTSLGRVNLALAGLVFLVGVILKNVKIKEAFLIAAVTAAISYFSFSLNSQEAAQRLEKPTQVSDRDILYKGASEIFFERPLFGYGPNSFHEIFKYKDQLADKGIGSWHNDLLQIYIESGIFTVAAFFMLIVIPLWQGFKFYRRKIQDDEVKKVTGGLIISAGILFASSLTSAVIISPVLSMVYSFLYAGISGVLIKQDTKELN